MAILGWSILLSIFSAFTIIVGSALCNVAMTADKRAGYKD